ncbi:hypothetical protein SDJN02_02756, partial [Cucurbita argyrosperma subsp. argyrosperma]
MFQVIPEVDMAMNYWISSIPKPVNKEMNMILHCKALPFPDLNVYRIFEAVPGDHMHKSLRIGMEATLLFKGIKAPVMLLSMQFCEVVTRPESSLITGTSSESYSYKSSMSVDCDSSYACSVPTFGPQRTSIAVWFSLRAKDLQMSVQEFLDGNDISSIGVGVEM